MNHVSPRDKKLARVHQKAFIFNVYLYAMIDEATYLTRKGFLHFADVPKEIAEVAVDEYHKRNPFCHIRTGQAKNENGKYIGIYAMPIE